MVRLSRNIVFDLLRIVSLALLFPPWYPHICCISICASRVFTVGDGCDSLFPLFFNDTGGKQSILEGVLCKLFGLDS